MATHRRAVLSLLVCCAGVCAGEAPTELVWRREPIELNDYNRQWKLGPELGRVEFITIHNTAEPLTAAQERDRVDFRRDDASVSFHFAVDENEAVQLLPETHGGWHAGDGGKGPGNSRSLGIEICRSQWRGDMAQLYRDSEENAVTLAAALLDAYNLPTEALRTHRDWSGKFCPHRILEEGRWEEFKQRVADRREQGYRVVWKDAGERPDAAAGLLLHSVQTPEGENAVQYRFTSGEVCDSASRAALLARDKGGRVLVSSWVRGDDGAELLAALREAGVEVEGYFAYAVGNNDYERVDLCAEN